MRNSKKLKPVSFKEVENLTDFSLVTFDADCVSWSEGVWTVSRVTEKAILIDNEWLPKSQIVDVSVIQRKQYDAEGNYKVVTIPQLKVSSWFDKQNNSKRPKGYAF